MPHESAMTRSAHELSCRGNLPNAACESDLDSIVSMSTSQQPCWRRSSWLTADVGLVLSS